MDIATLVGLIAAITCLSLGIGPDLSSAIDAPALVIVVGGTIATALIANPLQDVVSLIAIYWKAVSASPPDLQKLVERIVAFAENSRREGMRVVGERIAPDEDPFLAQGLRLAVAGQETDLITDILKTDLQCSEERHARAQRVVGSLGLGGLVFGLIGAALAIALRPDSPATGLAVASAAALPMAYGLVIFGVFTEPFRRKLRAYGEKESLAKRLVIEGIALVPSSDPPPIVEHKLAMYLPPWDRPTG